MARKIPPQNTPPSGRHNFWLTHAFRARYEGDKSEDPLLSAARAPHVHWRHAVRRRKPLEALVNYGMTNSVLRQVRDLSPTDAFVEMSPANLSVGSEVEFVLRYRYQGRLIELRLSATVNRVVPDGVALKFGKYDDITYTDLVNLLYAA
jgi:hypothetical protein